MKNQHEGSEKIPVKMSALDQTTVQDDEGGTQMYVALCFSKFSFEFSI